MAGDWKLCARYASGVATFWQVAAVGDHFLPNKPLPASQKLLGKGVFLPFPKRFCEAGRGDAPITSGPICAPINPPVIRKAFYPGTCSAGWAGYMI